VLAGDTEQPHSLEDRRSKDLRNIGNTSYLYTVEEMKARMNVFEETLDKMDASGKACLGKMKADIETCQKQREAESKTDLEEMDATDVEANPEEMKSLAEHLEVPKEGAAVETIGALEDRQGDRHLAVERRRLPKKRTQGDGGSRKKLAVACRQMSRRAVPAWRKQRDRNRPAVEETQRNEPECNNGIRDRTESV
jgi:hypothetical protein